MTTLEILRAAYHLLDDKRRWTQDEMARDGDGLPVASHDPDATCWCAYGAIEKVGRGAAFRSAVDLLEEAMPSSFLSIVHLNDAPDGYRRVRAAFRKAIRRLEQQAAT